MSSQALSDALASLLTDAGYVWVSTAGDPGGTGTRAYDGQVLDSDTGRFVLITQRFSESTIRSSARTLLASTCLVRATVTHLIPEGVRRETDNILAALDGARLNAAGWDVGTVELINSREPIEDRDVTVAGNLHPIFAVLEFRYTATQTP